MTAKSYDFFSGSQEDINRRLLRKIIKVEEEIKNIPTEIGYLASDLEMLKAIVGTDSSKGLYKIVTDLQLTVGDDDSGLIKRVNSVIADIGNDTTPGTIKGRIKALEDKE